MDRRLEILELGEQGRILTCENIQNKERSGPCIESVVEKFTQGPAWASATSLLSIDTVERVRHKMSESAVEPDPRFDLIIHAALEKERIMMWEEKRLGDKEKKAGQREQIWCNPARKELHSCVPKWMHDIIRQWRRIWKTFLIKIIKEFNLCLNICSHRSLQAVLVWCTRNPSSFFLCSFGLYPIMWRRDNFVLILKV